MNTKQLKAKVLDLAIHGKLLSPETVAELKKSPEYETADVLLEKIRKEKEEKIAKGELKRDKKDSYIFVGDDKRHYEKFADGTVKDIEDEIPFDVPEGWAWASLSQIADLYTGNSINENEKANKYLNIKEGLFYIATKDIDFEGKINYDNGIRIPLSESKFKIAPVNSTLLCIEGGSAGRKIGFINQDVCFVNKLCCFHSNSLNNLYLFYYLQSRTFIDLFNANKIGLIGGVSLNLLKSIFIPVAPIIEQNYISKTITNYLEKISSLDNDKETLELTIKKAKSKILDLAIHGKLVPQDSNDEPASLLLEKLRSEKEEKIAKGELKRDKNDSYIYKGSDNCYYQRFADGHEVDISEEITFEIPDNWIWCRLRDLGDYKKGPFGSALKKSLFVQKSNNTIKVYEQKNAIQKNHKLGSYYITKDYFTSQMQGFEVLPGDIIVSCAGTIGETYVMPEKIENGIINQALMRMRITKFLNINYFLMYFDHILKEESAKSGKGTAIKNIPPFDVFKNFLIPIPPYEEQIRIVSKITELSIKLDSITNDIE